MALLRRLIYKRRGTKMISVSDLLMEMSRGMDAVEKDFFGAMPYHSKRVASYAVEIGKILGLSDERLYAMAGSALLHDNALTEYIISETDLAASVQALQTHCLIGQWNAESFPWPCPIDGFIQYHHEFADGSGAFGLLENEYPIEAAIICIADRVDVLHGMYRGNEETLQEIYAGIEEHTGSYYSRKIAAAALEAINLPFLVKMKDDAIDRTLREEMPQMNLELSDVQRINVSKIAAHIIDYKSHFTEMHSVQIADKAWHMATVYGYPSEDRLKIFTAAAYHDIGKLFIPTSILEKPGRLSDAEFDTIKSHAYMTWDLLGNVRGMEQIARWASNHHEKLDGSGYPFGKTAKDLDFIDRLLACIDIYQAVREKRPYHEGRNHADTMEILMNMADNGFIDRGISLDLDRELVKFEGGVTPTVLAYAGAGK